MTGVIYFAEQIGGPLVKIGWTKGCPKRRVQSLQTGSPVKLRLLGAIPAESIEDEKRLHAQFAGLRVKGEWFKRSQEILALLPKPSHAPLADKKEARLSRYVLDRFRLFILNGFSSVDEMAEMSGVRAADLRAGSIQGFFDAEVDWRKVNMALDKKRARYPMRREMDFATRSIRAWRDLNDVSVKEFAEMVGVQDSAVSKWERRGVSAAKALDVHRATGIPLHRLRPDIYPDPAGQAPRFTVPHNKTKAGAA